MFETKFISQHLREILKISHGTNQEEIFRGNYVLNATYTLTYGIMNGNINMGNWCHNIFHTRVKWIHNKTKVTLG